MKVSQQIVGVNQRLGNTAVPNMQGTTRMIYDSVATTNQLDATYTFFSGVSSRVYPLSNLSSNRFEVGESLAIQGFTFQVYLTSNPTLATAFNVVNNNLRGGILNLYIGNQRVIKDLEIVSYSRFGIGESISETTEANVFRLETPIVIPPQIEFYATLRLGVTAAINGYTAVLAAYGTGTLLNTKSNF
jgi:hypothetical protein